MIERKGADSGKRSMQVKETKLIDESAGLDWRLTSASDELRDPTRSSGRKPRTNTHGL
jgi:hypothetical protein